MNANQEYAIIGGAGGSDQTTTMPTPSAENLGTIVQYVGDTNQYYTNGYFYKVVSNGEVSPTYSREQVDTQPASSGEEHEFITQADYDNLTPAQKAEKVYMIKENGVVPGSGGVEIELIADSEDGGVITGDLDDYKLLLFQMDTARGVTSTIIVWGDNITKINFPAYPTTHGTLLYDENENKFSNDGAVTINSFKVYGII